MSPSERPVLCVSIHDVAPATWPECLVLLAAIRAVADIPLTWLVVPQYHGSELRSHSCEAMLDSLLDQGHELALHGYTHVDTAPPARGLGARFLRSVYTQREGEFAAIDADEARRRLELGLAWFRERAWPASGFVAPAWLMGDGAWRALSEYPFAYTTTFSHFHLLRPRQALWSPSIVYAARNRSGRVLSPLVANRMAQLLGAAPLVRVALHPRDARYPALVLRAQRLIEHLLRSREALTKASYAQRMARDAITIPSARPCASASVRSPRSSSDSHNAPFPPWC